MNSIIWELEHETIFNQTTFSDFWTFHLKMLWSLVMFKHCKMLIYAVFPFYVSMVKLVVWFVSSFHLIRSHFICLFCLLNSILSLSLYCKCLFWIFGGIQWWPDAGNMHTNLFQFKYILNISMSTHVWMTESTFDIDSVDRENRKKFWYIVCIQLMGNPFGQNHSVRE